MKRSTFLTLILATLALVLLQVFVAWTAPLDGEYLVSFGTYTDNAARGI